MSAVRLPDSWVGAGRKTTRLMQQRQQPSRLLARSKAALQQDFKWSVRRSAVQQHLPRVTWGIPKAKIKQTEMNRAIEVSQGEWGYTWSRKEFVMVDSAGSDGEHPDLSLNLPGSKAVGRD